MIEEKLSPVMREKLKQKENIELFIRFGADLSIKNKDGKTVMDLVKDLKYNEILEYLDVSAGAKKGE